MLTACGVQAFILQPQSFYRLSADDVLLNDFIDVGQSDASVPDCLGIDDDIRPVFALVEASCLIGADSALQSALGKFDLEQLLKFGLGGGIATSAGMSGRTLVAADKNVALEFRHSNIVQASGVKVATG
jgi:hypothetical protein